MKNCPQCNKEHNQNRSLCNKCYFLIPINREKRLIRNREYRNKNIEKRRQIERDSAFKCRYGITKKEFEIILKNQSSKCKICGKKDEVFCLDHNHKTSKIRGILCRNCNSALGLFKDSPKSLKMAIEYLKFSENS